MSTRRADAQTRQIIEREAAQAGIDPDLLEAIYNQESSANPFQEARTDTNGKLSYGPFQIQHARAIDQGFSGNPNELVPNPLYGNPNYPGAPQFVKRLDALDTNIHFAALAINDNQARCSGDPQCLAAGYNCPACARGGADGNYGAAQIYSNSVMKHYAGIKGGTYTADNVNPPGNHRRYTPNRPGGPGDEPIDPAQLEFVCKADLDEDLFPDGAPLPPNPNHPTFQFTVGALLTAEGEPTGGFDLTPTRPQYIQYFEYVDNIGVWSDQFTLRIFDPSWDIVAENEVLSAIRTANTENPQVGGDSRTTRQIFGFENCIMSWGYTAAPERTLNQMLRTDGLWSRNHAGVVLEYSPRFLGFGVEITLSGQSNESVQRLTAKSRTWPGQIQRSGTTISDIVQQLCDENGWGSCILPTQPLTLHNEPLKFDQAQMDDLYFIQHVLRPLAVAAQNPSLTGFLAHYDSRNNVLHFHPPMFSKLARHYTYARQRLGAVISFQPQVNPAMIVALGGHRIDFGGLDDETKEPFTDFVTDRDLPDAPILGPVGPPDEITLSTQKFLMGLTSSYPKKDLAKIEAKAMYETMRWSTVESTLVVVGDPTIRAGQVVRVTVFSKNGEPHYTSGLYLIKEARHVIQGGEYTTTLSLLRNAYTGEDSSTVGNLGQVLFGDQVFNRVR